MIRVPTFAIPLVAAVLLSACSSIPQRKETRCGDIDWWEMGRTDGVAGLRLEKGLAEHTVQCDGGSQPVDLELYENGRDAGLIDYCTPQQGLAAGHTGSPYEGVCPSYLETQFIEYYKVGRKLLEFENEDRDLESRIENLVALLAKSNSGTALRAQIEELRSRRAALDFEIARLEATNSGAPLPVATDSLLQKNSARTPASTPRTPLLRFSKESLRADVPGF